MGPTAVSAAVAAAVALTAVTVVAPGRVGGSPLDHECLYERPRF